MTGSRATDRRIGKTRSLLHGALAALIHEKPFDAIVVKEILGRANVGRSTFYSHFRDKGELLETGLRDMVRRCEAAGGGRPASTADDLLRFSLPLLEHIEQFRGGAPAAGVGGHTVVHERLRAALAESIERRVERLAATRPAMGSVAPPALVADFVASSFVLVVSWWMRSDEPRTAADADDAFRALVTPALCELVGAGAG